jgi:hypothetical protein
MLRESRKALLYLEHEAQLAAPNQLNNFPRTTMSLPKTALTAIFLLSVCSPALAETATKDTQAPVATSPITQNNQILVAPLSGTSSVSQSRSIDVPILNVDPDGRHIIFSHCCSCSGNSNHQPINVSRVRGR